VDVSKTPSKPTVTTAASKEITLAASPDDYYQKVAVQALLKILKDPSLSTHHHGVIEAIMSMFKTQGLKCVAFLPQVHPSVLPTSRCTHYRADHPCVHSSHS
jgi:FKBP12-rapamycin complex-associated protein